MVVIRMSRAGAKHRPFYNIVVTDSRSARDGRFIERVGFYNPVGVATVENLRIHNARVDYWVQKGAQLSPAVKKLLKKNRQQIAGKQA